MIYPWIMWHRPNTKIFGSIYDTNLHGIISVIVFIDNTVSAIPIQILHVIYPVIFGWVYVAFTLIYYEMDPENNILYPGLLNWNKPGITIGVILVVTILLMPLIQLAWYGWYRLIMWIGRKTCSRARNSTDTRKITIQSTF